MSKGGIIGIALFIGLFTGLNWMLTRSSGEEPVAVTEAQKVDKNETIRQMADFVQHNPNEFKPQVAGISISKEPTEKEPSPSHAPVVLGVALDKSSSQALQTPEGQQKFQASLGDHPAAAVQDLKQAWAAVEINDSERRQAMLEVTNAVAEVAPETQATGMLYQEAEKFMPPSEHQNLEYGGQALQYYVGHESDPERMHENLHKLGVPILNLDAQRAPASEPAY